MIRAIAFWEAQILFRSRLGWALLAVIQFLLAYLFFGQVDIYLTSIQPKSGTLENFPGVTALLVSPLYGNASVILMLLTPLVSMRAISLERSKRTLPLLISAPLALYEIVLGKYLGLLAFNLLAIAMISLMPLSLELATDLDYGKFAACILALFLVTSSFSAVGLCMSSLCKNPVSAASATFGLLLLLWAIDWMPIGGDRSEGILKYLSILNHFNNMRTGLIASGDVAYYVLLILTCLILSMRILREPSPAS